MSHPIVVEKLEQDQSLVVKERKLLRSEDLLTAVALFIELLVNLGACSGSIKHIDHRTVREVNESHVIEHCARVFVD